MHYSTAYKFTALLITLQNYAISLKQGNEAITTAFYLVFLLVFIFNKKYFE